MIESNSTRVNRVESPTYIYVSRVVLIGVLQHT